MRHRCAVCEARMPKLWGDHECRFRASAKGLKGILLDGESVVWRCPHSHRFVPAVVEPDECARQFLRELQLGRRSLATEDDRAFALANRPRAGRAEPRDRFRKGTRVPLPTAEWLRLFEEADHTCFYCGGKAGRFEADHVVPVARGGTSDPWNFVVACFECNRKKGPLTGREFIEQLTEAQAFKLDEVDRLLRRRRIPWLERRRLRKERRERRKAGTRQAVETRNQRADDCERAHRAFIEDVLKAKNAERAAQGLDPLPARHDGDGVSARPRTSLPAKPAPWFLRSEGGRPLRQAWRKGYKSEGGPGPGRITGP